MSHHISLLPSGRGFDANPEESILQCALRAGLALSHGCTRGTCGDCRARILRGEHVRHGHQDYSLTEAEKAAGTILLCRTAARSDLQIEVNLASGTEDVPHQAVPVKLTGVRRPSPGIAELTFKVQRARTFRFLAGQRAVLRAASGRTRALPIASCPCDGTTLRFLMSSHCADPLLRPILAQWPDDTARPHTQRFVLEGPEGDFVLSENSPNPLVFVSQDEGFGAINSLLEHALNLELGQPIFLLRLASDKAHFFAHNFCRSLADAYDNLSYWQDTIDPARDCGPGPYVAFATRTISRLSKLQAPFVYVSGSKEFCNAIQCVFEQGPVQAGRVRTDSIAEK